MFFRRRRGRRGKKLTRTAARSLDSRTLSHVGALFREPHETGPSFAMNLPESAVARRVPESYKEVASNDGENQEAAGLFAKDSESGCAEDSHRDPGARYD